MAAIWDLNKLDILILNEAWGNRSGGLSLYFLPNVVYETRQFTLTKEGYRWWERRQVQNKKHNYQLQISFDTKENRRKWLASDQHMKTAWPAATKLAKSYKWRGYDVTGDDNQLLKR